MRRFLLTLLMICCSGSIAFAAVKNIQNERVVAIKPDGSMILASSGPAVFTNIVFPNIKRAESWLAEHALQQEISFIAEDEDRYGRTRITSEVEEKMLRDGAAIIYVSDGKISDSWQASESVARAAKAGVWSDKEFVLHTENAAQHQGEFHVIEGTITRIYEAKTATYLNFGDDWHSDFSITIPAKARRSMKALLQQIKAGSSVRVRGTIYEENGPMIRLMEADNIELR